MKPDRRDHLDGNVVVWIVSVAALSDSLSYLEPFLDSADQTRAARFRFPEDRARFVLGRALIRKGIGHYLGRNPEEIELAYTERGRPFLPQDEAIQFSISHTHDLVAFALTSGAKVGVDLEYFRANLDLPGLARRIFSDDDFRIFQDLPEVEKTAAFFRAWTAKEAYLKARGEGISEGLQQISLSLGPEMSPFLRDARDPSVAEKWRLHPLPVAADYMGTLACDDAQKQLDFRRVRFQQGDVLPE